MTKIFVAAMRVDYHAASSVLSSGHFGKQSDVPELEGTAVQNRFNLLFEKFIRVFATKEHPLVQRGKSL